jgi:hypothetical protein
MTNINAPGERRLQENNGAEDFSENRSGQMRFLKNPESNWRKRLEPHSYRCKCGSQMVS